MSRDLYGLGDYSTDQIKAMVRVVEEEGMAVREIYLRRPDAAPDPRTIIKEMPLSEVSYIIPDTFSGPRGLIIAQSLSLPQLQEIGAEGDDYLKEAIKIALTVATRQNPNDPNLQELKDYVDKSPAWQI